MTSIAKGAFNLEIKRWRRQARSNFRSPWCPIQAPVNCSVSRAPSG